MTISFWRLGWRSLWRDLRAGELRLLLLAVLLAVAALTAVGFFADRLQAGLQRDARQLLGGDAVLVGDQPLPPAFQALAVQHGLSTAQTLSFPTMARAPEAQGGQIRLVALKAVPAGYPLRGSLRVADAPDQPGTLTSDQVYSAVAFILNANGIIGENDEMNKNTLPKVKMPNEGNFIVRFPDRI